LDRRGPVRAAAIHGEEKGDSPNKMWSHNAKQRAPLVVRLTHEFHIAEAKVTKTAVDELRRSARGRAAEIASVDKGHAEACAGRLVRDACADNPTSDHEDVVRRARELCARRVALMRHQGHTGFVQALPPR